MALTVLEQVKRILGLPAEGTENDKVLEVMLEDAKTAITLYCNRKSFPEALSGVAREMVQAAYLADNEGSVSSIKRGDVQISYNQVITTDSFTEKQKMLLNRYRKLRIM